MGKHWQFLKKNVAWKEIFLIGGLAILLIIAAWQVFGNDNHAQTSAQATAEEVRLKEILEMIDGVGAAEVMISEGETGEKGVVIVCEGANRISVLMDVREAAATAIGVHLKNIKIYLKK